MKKTTLSLLVIFCASLLTSGVARAAQELICQQAKSGPRISFRMSLQRILPSGGTSMLRSEGAITGNQDGRPGNFDGLFTRAVLSQGKPMGAREAMIVIEAEDRGSKGKSVFRAEIIAKTMIGYVYTADESKGGSAAIPSDISRNGIEIKCFWPTHPGCDCGGPVDGRCGASDRTCK